MQTKQINDYKVVPIKVKSTSITNWKGDDLFNFIYSSVYIIAKRKSGKTQLIYNILQQITDQTTNVIIFCSTYEKDDTYIEIIKWLKENGIKVTTFDSLFDGKNNRLDQFMDGDLQLGGSIKKEKKKEKKNKKMKGKGEVEKIDMSKFEKYNIDLSSLMFKGKYIPLKFGQEPEKEIYKEDMPIIKKPKKIKSNVSPKYVFVFDDLSSELKSPSVNAFIKQARHHKAFCIFSSQYVNDLQPSAIKNMEVLILFKGHSIDKLSELHKHADLSIPLEDFINAYHYAVSEPYNFLYVDVVGETLRKNFDEEIII